MEGDSMTCKSEHNSDVSDEENSVSSFANSSDTLRRNVLEKEDTQEEEEEDHQSVTEEASTEEQAEDSAKTEVHEAEERGSNGFHGPSLAASLGLNLLAESSKMALTDITLREKRCRIFEREANEVKDLICSLNHTVHILENIKRVSREYIHYLYELIGSTIRADNDQVEQLHQEILELESELKQWERKYHVISSLNAPSPSQLGVGATFAGSSNDAVNAAAAAALLVNSADLAKAAALASEYSNNVHNHHHGSAGSSSENQVDDEQLESENADNSADIELIEAAMGNGKGANAAAAHPSLGMMLMPQELCEMSMETQDTESNATSVDEGAHRRRAAEAANMMMNPATSTAHSTASSPLIAAAVATASENLNLKQFKAPLTHNVTVNGTNGGSIGGNQSLQGSNSSSAKPLFSCDHSGCQYQTNMRQRLAMHKRAHAGEMLFSCDIAGCGYQSNYKGNIKIHKKHRHRIDGTAGEATSYPMGENGQNMKFRTRGRKRKAPPTEEAGSLSMMSNGMNGRAPVSNVQMKQFMQSARPSVIVSEDGVEAFLDGTEHQNGSSCDMYSGNDSGAGKETDLPLFECTVQGCNYRSKWKQCLTAHQFLHAGVKPFKCDHPGCNYRTNFKGNVNVHKRVHRAAEFQCKFPGCNFSTPWKNSFLIHQRNHVPLPTVPPPYAANANGLPAASRIVTQTNQLLTNTDPAQLVIESEKQHLSQPVTPSSRRRTAQMEQGAVSFPNIEHRTSGTSRSSARLLQQSFERQPPHHEDLLNESMAEHLLNGISAMQASSQNPHLNDFVVAQRQLQQQTVSLSIVPSGGASHNFDGAQIKIEDEEEELEEEEEELDEEEMLSAFAGQNLDANGLNHSFIMAEAANAVSQANQLAAMRSTALQNGDHRSGSMFDMSRYQEMI